MAARRCSSLGLDEQAAAAEPRSLPLAAAEAKSGKRRQRRRRFFRRPRHRRQGRGTVPSLCASLDSQPAEDRRGEERGEVQRRGPIARRRRRRWKRRRGFFEAAATATATTTTRGALSSSSLPCPPSLPPRLLLSRPLLLGEGDHLLLARPRRGRELLRVHQRGRRRRKGKRKRLVRGRVVLSARGGALAADPAAGAGPAVEVPGGVREGRRRGRAGGEMREKREREREFISLVVIVAVLKNQKGGVLEKCKCGPRTEAKQKERSKRIKKQKKTQKKNTFPFSLRPIPTHLHHTITFTARQTCRGRRSACPTPRCPGPCTRPPGRRRGGRSRLSGR